MTDTQNKLYPPLVDDQSDCDDDYDGDSSGNNPKNNPKEKKDKAEKSVLSNELQDRFKSMRSLLRGVQVDGEQSNNEEVKRKQRQMAMETALLVESEVSRLESGIAELENLLLQQGQQQHNQQFLRGDEVEQEEDDAEAVLVFPSLPSIVAEEDDAEYDEKAHVTSENVIFSG